MQTCDAFIVGERIKYADPLAICEARHKVPNMWENNYDVFKHCETPKEIARERKEQLKESMKTVMAYIEKMMQEWQDVADCISMP